MLGYSREELSKKHFSDFTHPDELEKDRMYFGEFIKGNRDFLELDVDAEKKMIAAVDAKLYRNRA